ncbi:MAG: hypothetical protein JRN20_05425 [Nitrososphaerota archaeon]|nr:hypothetical protein [Nitrososphaerota archaeon]
MPRYAIAIGLAIAVTIISLQLVAIPLSAAAPTREVDFGDYLYYPGGGATEGMGNVSCPSGFTATGEIFELNVTRTGGVMTGTWYMVHYGAAASEGGTITGGHINNRNFRVTADWTTDPSGYNTTIVCSSAPIPTTVLIIGSCGTDVFVTLAAANGVTGTFLGKAVCTFTHN